MCLREICSDFPENIPLGRENEAKRCALTLVSNQKEVLATEAQASMILWRYAVLACQSVFKNYLVNNAKKLKYGTRLVKLGVKIGCFLAISDLGERSSRPLWL